MSGLPSPLKSRMVKYDGTGDFSEAGQHLARSGEIACPVVDEHDDALVTLREQRDDIRKSVPREVEDFEPDRAGRGIEHLAPISPAILPIERQTPAVVAEFADRSEEHTSE